MSKYFRARWLAWAYYGWLRLRGYHPDRPERSFSGEYWMVWCL